MKMHINHKQAVNAIAACRDFKSGYSEHYGRASLTGENVSDAVYIVKSYAATIAKFVEGEGWYYNDTHYSPTTSRHQALVRRALSGGRVRPLEPDKKPASRVVTPKDQLETALAALRKKTFTTVADIPDGYALFTGDAAREFVASGCAFVLDHNGRRLSVFSTSEAVPYLDAPVRELYRAGWLAESFPPTSERTA